jgi:sterol desaturase/sphingolipid hydroxylase (fatty acid hydroxylase superfamily)
MEDNSGSPEGRGRRNSKGEWQPDVLPQPGPFFQFPWKPLALLKHLKDILWPWNLLFIFLAVISWMFFTPDAETSKTFAPGWIALVFARNAVILFLYAGALHLRLYIRKVQGTSWKYTDKWLAKDEPRFLFRNQTADNVFWSFVSGATIWTAWEVLTLWAFSNKVIPFGFDFRDHIVWGIAFFPIIIFFRSFHFYFVHRLIHWKPLYKASHYLHHKNINIGPWSGLSMHPIEHLLYFTGVLLHWIVPSSPVHAIFHLMQAGISPAIGHTGFHRFVSSPEGTRGLNTDQYFHYLHHHYFTVNFGTQEVPMDWILKTYHDGSPETYKAMMAARKAGK